MSKISVIGSLECKDGRADEMEVVLADMVAAAADEPGIEIYSYHRGERETFWFFALMASAEAMQSHGQTDAMKAVMGRFMELAAGPPSMSTTRPIAAIGFDLS